MIGVDRKGLKKLGWLLKLNLVEDVVLVLVKFVWGKNEEEY